MLLDPKNIGGMIPDGKSYRDTIEPSLYLRNRKTKVWMCVRRNGPKVIWIRLGDYPDLSVSEARRAAAIEKSKILQNKQSKSEATYTLEDIFQYFKAEKDGIKKSIRQDEQRLNRIPLLFHSLMIDITPDKLRKLKKIMKEKPVEFNRIRTLISILFNFARKTMDLSYDNVAEHVVPYPEQPKETIVPYEKAADFFRILEEEDFSRDFQHIIKCMLYLGQRSGNIFAMEWPEIDFSAECWIIPPEKAKGKREMPTPIPPEIIDILKERSQDPERNPRWVFPRQKRPVVGQTKAGYSRSPGEGHVICIKKQFKRFAALLGIPNLSPHDLRRTHGTWMLNAGASIEQVSASLHHKDVRITQKVYAKLLTGNIRKGVDLMREAINSAKVESEWE